MPIAAIFFLKKYFGILDKTEFRERYGALYEEQ